eukprot:gene12482-15692_t
MAETKKQNVFLASAHPPNQLLPAPDTTNTSKGINRAEMNFLALTRLFLQHSLQVIAIASSNLPTDVGVLLNRKPEIVSQMIHIEKQPIAAPQVPAVPAAEPVVAMEVPVTPAGVLAVAATVPVHGGEERDDTSKSSCRQLLSLFCAPMRMLWNAVLLLVEQTTGTKVSKAAGASSKPSCSPLLQRMLWNAVLLWVERAATGKDTKAGAASSKPSRSPLLQRMLWGAALSWVESAATAKVTKSSGDSSQPSSRPILLPMLGNAVLSCVQKAAYAKVNEPAVGSAKPNCSPLLRLLCNTVLLLQASFTPCFCLKASGPTGLRLRASFAPGFIYSRLHLLQASVFRLQASGPPDFWLLASFTPGHRLQASGFKL